MSQCLAPATILVMVALLQPANAAPDGFIDCDKTATQDEKVICGSTHLLQQDARMVTMFKIASDLAGMGTRGDLRDGQVKWLERRHACRDDQACLRDAYASRIGQIGSVIDAITARGPF